MSNAFHGFGQVQEQYRQATQLAEADRFTEAVEAYRAILNDDYQSAELFYNLGSCYLAMDSIPAAILNLERAIKFSPNYRAAREQIEVARSRIDEAVIPVTPFFLSDWTRSLSGLTSLTGWSILSILLFWLIAFLIAGFIKSEWMVKNRSMHVWLTVIVSILLLISIAMATYSYSRLSNNSHAIVQRDIELKVGPDDLSTSLQRVAAGEKIFLVQSIDGWYQVELLNRDIGWMKEEHFLRI